MVDQTALDPIYPRVVAVLRAGFRIAAGLLLVGISIALIRREPLAERADAFADIPAALADLDARGFIDLAIIAIVLTPLAAVVTILRGFLAAGDTRFARLTGGVLAILVASIVLSLFQ
jgi:uncharacterized membrane protein